MRVIKSIQLTTIPLEAILKNRESIDFRLDQEAWKDIEIGDHLEFWEDFTGWDKEPSENSRRVIVEVKNIYKAPTFAELFEIIEKEFKSLGNKENLLNGLRGWWSEEKEVCTGTLAFHVCLVE